MEDERRNDTEIKVIDERVVNLKSQLEASDKLSEAWRVRFCTKLDSFDKKLDDVMHKIDTLPCPMREARTSGIMSQIKALWVVTGGMVIAIISEWVKMK